MREESDASDEAMHKVTVRSTAVQLLQSAGQADNEFRQTKNRDFGSTATSLSESQGV